MIKLLLATALILRTGTDLCFKWAVHRLHIGSVQDAYRHFLGLLISPVMWLAISLALINLWLWCLVLSHFDLSFAYPLFSFSYVLMMIGGKVFFGESLGPYKWAGMALITAGSLLLIQG